jgi:hypothetical protein
VLGIGPLGSCADAPDSCSPGLACNGTVCVCADDMYCMMNVGFNYYCSASAGLCKPQVCVCVSVCVRVRACLSARVYLVYLSRLLDVPPP